MKDRLPCRCVMKLDLSMEYKGYLLYKLQSVNVNCRFLCVLAFDILLECIIAHL